MKSTALAALMLMLPAAAHGARPFATEDTGTVGRGRYQLEIGAATARDRAAGVNERERRYVAQFAYGLADAVDAAVGIPWFDRETTGAGAATRGPGDLEASLKWRFHRHGGFSLALRSAVLLATGDEGEALGTGRTRYDASLVASRRARPWELDLQLGYTRHRNTIGERTDLLRASALLVRGVGARTRVGLDLGAATNPDPGDDCAEVFAIFGLIHTLSRGVELDLGYHRGLSDPATDRVLIAGITLVF